MMMADWQIETDDGWWAAVALADDLEAGRDLPELDSALQLGPDETLHVAVTASCWWYGNEDVTYQHSHFLVFGSLAWLGLTAAASALGNYRRRKTAEALAAPQWHPLGEQPVLLTNQRILVPLDDNLASIWLGEILDAQHPDGSRLNLVLDGRPPLMLAGAWIPYLNVALHFLTQSIDPALPQPTDAPESSSATGWTT